MNNINSMTQIFRFSTTALAIYPVATHSPSMTRKPGIEPTNQQAEISSIKTMITGILSAIQVPTVNQISQGHTAKANNLVHTSQSNNQGCFRQNNRIFGGNPTNLGCLIKVELTGLKRKNLDIGRREESILVIGEKEVVR